MRAGRLLLGLLALLVGALWSPSRPAAVTGPQAERRVRTGPRAARRSRTSTEDAMKSRAMMPTGLRVGIRPNGRRWRRAPSSSRSSSGPHSTSISPATSRRASPPGGLTYVPFTIANTGAAPAENVVVLFEIKRGEEPVEESTAEVAFLPNSGSAEGELVTAHDLTTHTVEGRVATFQEP